VLILPTFDSIDYPLYSISDSLGDDHASSEEFPYEESQDEYIYHMDELEFTMSDAEDHTKEFNDLSPEWNFFFLMKMNIMLLF